MSEKDFDKGYKSGFKFGKEVANEEWIDKIKQARNEIYNLVETVPFTAKTQIEIEFNTKVLAILDELIESEG